MAVPAGFQLLVLDVKQQGLQGGQGQKAVGNNGKADMQQDAHLVSGDGVGLVGKKDRADQAENGQRVADQKQVLDRFAPHEKQQHDHNDVGDGGSAFEKAEFPACCRRNQ